MEALTDRTYRERLSRGDIFIGDRTKPSVFSSHVEFTLWGEGDRLTFDNEGKEGIEVMTGEAISLVGGDRDEEWVKTGSMLRWIFTLKSKPQTYTYGFNVGGNWSDFNWNVNDDDAHLHTPTRYIEPRAGHWGEAGEWWDKWTHPNGDITCCPVSAHGSISVVHKTKRSNLYKTGKVLGILMPKLTDAAGEVTWAEKLSFDNGLLEVTLPKKWLLSPSRQYPVKINDTFGDESTGSYWTNWNKNQARFFGDNGAGFATGAAGTLNNIQAYMQGYGGDEDYTAAIYLDNGGGSPDGSSPVNVSTPVTIGGSDSAAWVQFDSSGAIADDSYYFALWHGGTHNEGQINHDWTGGHEHYDATTSMPDPAASTYLRVFRQSIYGNYTPSSGDKDVPVSAQTLTLAAPAPTIVISAVETPAAQAMTLASPAPAPSVSAVPSDQALTLAAPAPTVVISDVETPAAQALTLVSPAPAPSVSAVPSAEALTIAAPAPAVRIDATVTPAAQALTLAAPAPAVRIDATVTPAAQALTLAAPAPAVDVSGTVTVQPTALSLSLSAPAPTVAISDVETPAAQALTLVSPAPAPSVSAVPSAEALTIAAPAPTVRIDATVTPAAQALTLAAPAPAVDVSGSSTVQPTALSLSLSAPAPTVVIDSTVTPSALALTLAIPTPTPTVAFLPADQAVTLAAPAASVRLDSTFSASAQSLTLGSPAPTISAGVAMAAAAFLIINRSHA